MKKSKQKGTLMGLGGNVKMDSDLKETKDLKSGVIESQGGLIDLKSRPSSTTA